jgi:hypothetical protein
MKRTIFVGLMTCLATGAIAQVTPPSKPGGQSTPSSVSESAVPQVRDSRALTFPYLGTGSYNQIEMDKVPQSIRTKFGSDYLVARNASWEYNDDVYRGSFEQDGKTRSVIFSPDGHLIEARTGMTVEDLPSSVQNAVSGRKVTSSSEIKVGNNTYYSTQEGGKEVYYDSNGNAIKIPEPRKDEYTSH